jgi:beta-glucanase (GH16 family)
MSTKATVIKIKVNFTLNTPNGLRRVIFGLEKDTQGDVVSWTINFQLFERAKKTDPYTDPIVDLNVEVDKALNAKAEKASQGLTASQAAFALGPAADDAKAAENGDIDPEDAQQTVQKTLKK